MTRMSEKAPLLGQAAYVQRLPRDPALGSHFARVWSHAVPQGASGLSAIVPDGCADLIWFGGRLYIAGPDRQAKIEHVPPGADVIGLRFRPGAAAGWLGTNAADLVDARLLLDDVWGPAAARLAAWIGEADGMEEAMRRLEHGLAERAPQAGPPDDLARAIFTRIGSRRDFSQPVMAMLGDAFGLSERSVRRRCMEAFGYGPKTLDGILRFQRFLRLAARAGNVGIADLAADAGYADQPHLTRDARRLAGLTPAALRRQFASSSAPA